VSPAIAESAAFEFCSVAHLEAPAGIQASSLAELRAGIAAAPPRSLFHHVSRVSIRFPRARDLPPNDFSRWVETALQEPETAERLAFAGVDPLLPLEELRASLLRVLDAVAPAARQRQASEGAAFHFVRVESVPVPLARQALVPADAVAIWPEIDLAAVFYHLIEAPVLGPAERSLVAWLEDRGAPRLADSAAAAAAGGRPLVRLHRDLAARWGRSLIASRLVRRTEAPEHVRRSDAQAAMARLAEKLRRKSGGGAGS
jgi:uncharacterized protein DUF5752